MSEETVTWLLDWEQGRLVQGLTEFIMDQNFVGSLLHVESRMKNSFLATWMLVIILFHKAPNLLSQSSMGVAFLIALVKHFTLCDVLADFPINPR